MAFIAGHYTATWNSANIGGTREGFRLNEAYQQQQVISDDYGEAPVSGVQQGAIVTVALDFIEYDLIRPALIAAAGTQGDGRSRVGYTMVANAKALVLTPQTGTSADTLSGRGGIITFYKAIVRDNVEHLLSSKLRQGPCRFHCYPDPDNSYKSYDWAAS